MASQVWSINTLGGFYATSKLSRFLREQAEQLMVFGQFVEPEPGVGGKHAGDTVLINIESDLDGGIEPADYQISETDLVPESQYTIAQKSAVLKQYARAVTYTELLDNTSEFPIKERIQKKLRKQSARVLDKLYYNQFIQGDVIYTPTGAATYQMDFGGVATQVAQQNLDMWHIETIRDWLRTQNIPPVTDGGEYVCVLSTKARRGIMRDTDWEKWHMYTDPKTKWNGETDWKVEGIRFVEETNCLSNALGLASCLGEAIFFGADAVRQIVQVPLELRGKIPSNYGLSRGICWYTCLAVKCVWEYATEGAARIVWVTSA